MSREITNRLIETIDQSGLESETVLTACLKYMSEQDVADMVRINDFYLIGDREDD
jgi:hypothetical protein